MSEIVDQVLDSVTNSEPSEVVVQDIEESTPEEPVVEESVVEEPVVEESVVEKTAPEEPVVEESVVEEPVVEESVVEKTAPEEPVVEEPVVEESVIEEPVVEESVSEKSKQMDQVINEIRELVKDKIPVSNELVSEESLEVPNDSSDNVTEDESNEFNELTDDLKQRIAELDYLRECCGNWVVSGRVGKRNFLTAWTNKNVSVNSNVNYEDTLNQLEKLPEIVKLWAERKVTTNSNHFKNIQSYTLGKPLFNEKSLTEKVEVVEQLITLLIDCANRKMRDIQIEEVIDNLY